MNDINCENFEYSCRLYIHSDKGLQDLKSGISAALSGTVVGSFVETDCLHIKMNKWDGFDISRINDFKGFLYYRYSAEVDAIHEIYPHTPQIGADNFRDQLCKLVSYLRDDGALVVVASDFNDVVVEKTGWNWSEDSPVHP